MIRSQRAFAQMTPTHAASHMSVDYTAFHAINGVAGHHPALDAIMIATAKYSPELLALVLAGLWLTWNYCNQRGAFLAGVSALLALGAGQVVGMLLPRDRPYLAHHVTLLVPHAPDTSFPSDHATLAFAVAVMVWQFNRSLGGLLLLLGVVVCFARVFIGAHYPTDVIGGAVLGAITSILIRWLSERTETTRTLDRIFTFLARWRLAASPARAPFTESSS